MFRYLLFDLAYLLVRYPVLIMMGLILMSVMMSRMISKWSRREVEPVEIEEVLATCSFIDAGEKCSDFGKKIRTFIGIDDLIYFKTSEDQELVFTVDSRAITNGRVQVGMRGRLRFRAGEFVSFDAEETPP